ncbi:hypothetical protein ACT3SP_11820 [Brachybacterium sp. AOP43-C2-M15]|uniref:hypothetical protein n=1 Tax=Brachybacterium sp. AOP43-C2-M15 TaxID=3457661 RepID=UPI004034C6BB
MTHPPHHQTSAPGPASAPGPVPGPAPAGNLPGRPLPGKDLGADLGAGLRFALDAVLRNPVAFVVPGVIYGILVAVLFGGGMITGFVLAVPQMETAASSDEMPLGVILTIYGAMALGGLLAAPLMWFWQTGAVRAGRAVVEGGRPTFGQAMIGSGRLLLTLLLVGLIVVVGMLLLYVPGLIASVLLTFALPAAARGARPVEAIKESISLVRANLATTIVVVVLVSAIGSVAGMLVITVVVLVPFIALFHLGIYERLSGRELPEPARA